MSDVLDALEPLVSGTLFVGSFLELIEAQMDALELYHAAYAAHHGERGPDGCPCCAEFAPKIAASFERLSAAISAWEAPPVAEPVRHNALPREVLVAERQFLIASTNVWHEIDRLTRQHGRYPGLPQETDLRVHEKAAWETYRDLMDQHDLMVCPRCEGQAYDVGSCHLCENTGYTRIGNS